MVFVVCCCLQYKIVLLCIDRISSQDNHWVCLGCGLQERYQKMTTFSPLGVKIQRCTWGMYVRSKKECLDQHGEMNNSYLLSQHKKLQPNKEAQPLSTNGMGDIHFIFTRYS